MESNQFYHDQEFGTIYYRMTTGRIVAFFKIRNDQSILKLIDRFLFYDQYQDIFNRIQTGEISKMLNPIKLLTAENSLLRQLINQNLCF